LSNKIVKFDKNGITSKSDDFFDKINSVKQFKIEKDFILNLEEEEYEINKNYKKLANTFSNVLFGNLPSNFFLNNTTVDSFVLSLRKEFIYFPLYAYLYIVFGVFLI
jgi:hypothetical protein